MSLSASRFRIVLSRLGTFRGNLLIIAFVGALAVFVAWQSRANYEQQALRSANNLSQLLGEHVVSTIERIGLALNTIAGEALQQPERGEIGTGNLNRLLASQKSLLPDVAHLMASDARGRLSYGPEPLVDRDIDISDRDYFRRLRDDPQAGIVVSGPHVSRASGDWGLVVARRLNRPDGSFAGVVRAFVNVGRFEKMLSALDLGPRGMASLRTAELTLIARYPNLGNTGDSAYKAVSATFLEQVRVRPGEGAFRAVNPLDQVERSIAYRRLGEHPLYIAVGLAEEDYLAPWRDEVMQLAAMVAIFSLVTLWLSRHAQRSAAKEKASSRLLQEAVDNAAVGLSIFDSQQRLVACNEAIRDFFPEYPEIFVPGARLEDIMRTGVARGKYPEARENTEQWIRERLQRHSAANGQPFEQTLSDGRQLLIIENHTPSGHVVSNRIDITELTQYRQQLEQLVDKRTAELKAALDQFRILVELSPSALAMFDRKFNYVATSRRWAALYGKGRSQLVGLHLYDVAPDIPEHWKAAQKAALAGIMDSREEDLWVQADGSERWLRWAVHPWKDAGGDIGGIIMSVEDITDRKLAEKRLQDSERRFRSIFEQAAVGLAYISLDGIPLQCNGKFSAILGYTQEELSRMSFREVTCPEDLPAEEERAAQLISGAIDSCVLEKRYIRKDGAVIWGNLTISLARRAGGEPAYFIAVLEDIQQRKDVEQALADERETRRTLLEQQVSERTAELQSANRQLEGFLFAASHDLKGPLGRISSFSSLLEQNYRERLEGNGLMFLGFIRENALRLTAVIDDLLNHARVDQQACQLEPIELRRAVQVALYNRTEEIRELGTVVRFDMPPAQVYADPHALTQVLNNLLENALKYSAESLGPVIEIGGERIGNRFRFWVKDNGIGFDMEYHDKIFEIFRRLHTYAEYAGTGVGLALVKRAMERMGGKVWAESEPGQGATFYLEFEVAARMAELQ